MQKLLITTLCALALPAFAAYPEKPVRLIVPLAAGGGMDTTARSIATPLGERLGQSVVVDNRPGGGGNVGVDIMREAPADGHTLFMGSATFVIHPLLYKARYVPARDFLAITQVTSQPYVLIVHPGVPAKTVKELVAYTKANPNKINYASSGQGSLIHLTSELFKVRTGADMIHVPYKGMAQGIPDLLEGRIQLVITGLPAVATQLKSGKLRVLATTESRRTVLNPDIPTFAEAGVPGVEMETWLGMVAPAGTPRAAIDQANAAFNRALKLPQVREKLAAQGLEVMGGTAETFNARIRSDIESFRKVSRAAGLKPE